MPQAHLRSKSRKRSNTPLPGNRKGVHYRREKTVVASCSMCGRPLSGLPRLKPMQVRKLNRTKRRVWRLYGGNLCHDCLKNALRKAARAS